jgi:hypothetical protein
MTIVLGVAVDGDVDVEPGAATPLAGTGDLASTTADAEMIAVAARTTETRTPANDRPDVARRCNGPTLPPSGLDEQTPRSIALASHATPPLQAGAAASRTCDLAPSMT